MIDTYIKSNSLEELVAYCGFFSNSIIPQNRADEPGIWYSCIRAPVPVSGTAEVQVVDANEGRAVCGVWS